MLDSHKQIVVGISGGVDSSVAALLLKQAGHEVTGLFMQNWEAETDDPYCTAAQDLTDARIICDKLGIPLRTVNFSKTYWEKVFQYFLNELAAGRTPNPDVLCNQEIKFKAFLDHALSLGAQAIATGHYAQLTSHEGETLLVRSQDTSKDQTYFLHRLNQHQLANSLFPIGHLEKKVVRKIAQEAGFITSSKKDSTGICFIGERKFKEFLGEYLLAQPGEIKTETGTVLGKHEGLMFYTLGQRQGLGIGGQNKFSEAPWYVLAKDIPRNTLIVGQDQNHPYLMKDSLICSQIHWIAKPPTLPFTCSAKIRYRQIDQACIIYPLEQEQYQVNFKQPQRAITPGQYVVFYHDQYCLGGGVIC